MNADEQMRGLIEEASELVPTLDPEDIAEMTTLANGLVSRLRRHTIDLWLNRVTPK
jgi:hypothetical protein